MPRWVEFLAVDRVSWHFAIRVTSFVERVAMAPVGWHWDGPGPGGGGGLTHCSPQGVGESGRCAGGGGRGEGPAPTRHTDIGGGQPSEHVLAIIYLYSVGSDPKWKPRNMDEYKRAKEHHLA